MSEPFDPADARSWLTHGREAVHADAIAAAWRQFPDLPPDAPLEARMFRTRDRVAALRPLHEAIRIETERHRQRANFAFVERQLAAGIADARNAAILSARDVHGHGWDAAVAFAAGWYAAKAGWDSRAGHYATGTDEAVRRRAYEQGFTEGGGRPDDLFDAARRSLVATPVLTPHSPKRVPRALPSQWPIPTDRPLPVSWRRRLFILAGSEMASATIGILEMLRRCRGHEAVTLLIADAGFGLRRADAPWEQGQHLTLRPHLVAKEFGDILVVADGPELRAVDAQAHLLPVCRTMERTANSVLQQRAQFRLWLERGRAPDEQFAAGHIRWSKMAPGLTGRLGDFTARYGGPARPHGHRILIDDADGALAVGYFSPHGAALDPVLVITNKAHMRSAMAGQLRRFAAALRLG